MLSGLKRQKFDEKLFDKDPIHIRRNYGYLHNQNYHPEMLESWLRCRALAYMRSSFQDEITAEKEHVSADNGISLVAVKDQQVIGIAEAIFLDHGEAKAESY
ncbi:GNAT family acetyltransferase, partial [Lacticaseibacillus paracasei subsp. paracasei Lpp48]